MLFHRQQTICLFFKNALKSILVRRFFSHFTYFIQILKIKHFARILLQRLEWINLHIKTETYNLLDFILKSFKYDFDAL